MQVFWGRQAELDREDVFAYIADDNPAAAVRMDELFSAAGARLAEHPRLGKPGLVGGTRELIVHENYRLVYEVDDEAVWILTLVHVARMWPPRQA